MDIFGALAIAAIATATAIASQVPAVRKAVQTAVNTVVTPVVDWWNENVAAPSAPSGDGDDGDDGSAPARQSGGEIGAVAQPEPTYDPDVEEFAESDTPETLAAEVADQRAVDISQARHIGILLGEGALAGPNWDVLADYVHLMSLALMVIHEPGILMTALLTSPTVAKALDGLFANSYLAEDDDDNFSTRLEYEFGPALKRQVGERLDARENGRRHGAGYGKAGYDLQMAADGVDDVSQDEPKKNDEQIDQISDKPLPEKLLPILQKLPHQLWAPYYLWWAKEYATSNAKRMGPQERLKATQKFYSRDEYDLGFAGPQIPDNPFHHQTLFEERLPPMR